MQDFKQIEQHILSNSQYELIDFDGQFIRFKLNASGSYVSIKPYKSYAVNNSDSNILITSNDLQFVQPHTGEPNQKILNLNNLDNFLNLY